MSTSQIGSLRALSGSLLAVTTIAVTLRFYARSFQRAFGADDWTILIGFVWFIGVVICMLLGINLGYWGSTDAQVSAEHISFYTELSLIISMDVSSTLCLGFTRISALLFYRRVFAPQGVSKGFRNTLHVTIGIIVCWMIAFIVVPILQCGPDLSVWAASPSVRATKCTLGAKYGLSVSITDLILEIWAIALPIPKILRLKTSWQRRLAVLFVFLTAFVSLGAVCARLGITYHQLYGGSTDKTQINTTSYFIWTLEAGFAIIAVNLPSLYWIRHKVKPESVLASIRSALSLQSMRSRASRDKSQEHNGAGSGPNSKPSGDRIEADGISTESREKLAGSQAESETHGAEERIFDKQSENDSIRLHSVSRDVHSGEV